MAGFVQRERGWDERRGTERTGRGSMLKVAIGRTVYTVLSILIKQ